VGKNNKEIIKEWGKLTTKSQLLAAIKAHCLECAGSWKDLKECPGSQFCKLHEYRLGVDPEGPSPAKQDVGRRLAEYNKSQQLLVNSSIESLDKFFTGEYKGEIYKGEIQKNN
jgi:hypothetical protein